MSFLYFTTEYAIKTHDKIIEISGGASGILNIGILIVFWNIFKTIYTMQNLKIN